MTLRGVAFQPDTNKRKRDKIEVSTREREEGEKREGE